MTLPTYRASEAHYLAARGRTKAPSLTQGAMTWLQEVWLRNNVGYDPDVFSKEMWKGIAVEDQALALYAKHYNDGRPVFKNELRMTAGQLTGECDARNREAARIIEIKNSYHPLSFIKADLNPQYYAQVQTYMFLHGYEEAHLCYCLLDLPDWLYQDELRKFCYQAQILDPEAPEHHEILEKHRRQFIYSDNPAMPEETRIKVYPVKYDQEFIDRIHEGIELANAYYRTLTLNKIHL